MKPVNDTDIDKLFLLLRKELNRKKRKEYEETGGMLFYGNGFRIELADGFEEAGKERKAAVFHSKNRPDTVFIHSQENAGITFQTVDTGSGLWEADLESARDEICRILQQADRRTVIYDTGEVYEGSLILWFDYKSFAADEVIYNMMFLFPANGKLTVGTFYCTFADYAKWKPVVITMLRTVRMEEMEA